MILSILPSVKARQATVKFLHRQTQPHEEPVLGKLNSEWVRFTVDGEIFTDILCPSSVSSLLAESQTGQLQQNSERNE